MALPYEKESAFATKSANSANSAKWVGCCRLDGLPLPLVSLELWLVFFENFIIFIFTTGHAANFLQLRAKVKRLKRHRMSSLWPQKPISSRQTAKSNLQTFSLSRAVCVGGEDRMGLCVRVELPATMLVIKFYCYLNDETGAPTTATL